MEKGVGIYIGRKEVIAACVVRLKGALQLKQFAIEPIIIDESEGQHARPAAKRQTTPESQAVERALLKMGIRHAYLNASISSGHFAPRFFKMPVIPRREWDEAIRFEARRYVPYKLDESFSDFHVEYHDLPNEGKSLWVTYTAVKQEVLYSHLGHLRKGTAGVYMVEPVFCSIARTLGVVEKDLKNKTYGFILIDADGSVNITLASQGTVFLCRDFFLSDDQVANETRFFQEVKASLDFLFNKSGQAKIDQIFLVGNGDLIFWNNFLTGVFGKQAEILLAGFPTEQNIPKNVLGALIVPIGLALLNLGYESPLGDFQLLPVADRQIDPAKIKKVVLSELFGIVLFFLAVYFVGLQPYLNRAKQEAVNQLSPEARADMELAQKAPAALSALKSELETGLNQLKQVSGKSVSMKEILFELVSAMPKSVWIEDVSYGTGRDGQRFSRMGGERQNEGGKLKFEIRGYCYLADAEKEVQEINQWVKDLNAMKRFSASFKSISLEEVKRQKLMGRDASQFYILCS